MRKKILLSVGIVIAAVLAFSVSAKNTNNGSMDLASLVKINTASAECTTEHNVGWGHCIISQQYCVGDPYNPECDFGW